MAKNKTYDKFSVLSYLFMNKTNNGTTRIGEDIDFTLEEVGIGIRETGGELHLHHGPILYLTLQEKRIQYISAFLAK